MNVAIFLDELNKFNGPLMFIPGSRKLGEMEALFAREGQRVAAGALHYRCGNTGGRRLAPLPVLTAGKMRSIMLRILAEWPRRGADGMSALSIAFRGGSALTLATPASRIGQMADVRREVYD